MPHLVTKDLQGTVQSNGPISPDGRLACAICWFAGGSTYDIMTTFGISRPDTNSSYWYVVDAINKHPNAYYLIQHTWQHHTLPLPVVQKTHITFVILS